MKIRNLLAAVLVGFSLSVSAAPKYIFYFIGDGMGLGAVSAAQLYNRMVLGNPQSLTMLRFDVASMAFTHSASSPVTDSAAAGTALACGRKTFNGMVGVTPDTVAVNSIATVLHEHGYGVGLVTTVAPDDATPAAFYAHQPHRSRYYEIGCQAAASGFEFISGARLRGVVDKHGQPTGLLDEFKRNDVAVVYGMDRMTNDRRPGKILLLNTDTVNNRVPHVIDSVSGQLTLPVMTRACLDHLLAVSPDHFFMMVEGGSIDHAAHANDAPAVVMETLGFDQSLAIAYDFYKEHPDETLIVVTADHETGGLILANASLHYNVRPHYLSYPRMSKDAFSELCKSMLRSRMAFTWDDMKRTLSERLGLYDFIPVSDVEDGLLHEKFDKIFGRRSGTDMKSLYSSFNEFAVDVYELINRAAGIGWTTGDHSGMVVPVFAVGCDAERFSAVQDNTEIPEKILSVAGY